jgi:hypothetical protein
MKKIIIKKPLVYIIIANWNGLDDTVECLESLKKITYPNYKVVVIDNGSKDKQAESIKRKFPYVHLIKNSKNTGFVVANNQGIEYAQKNKADYYLLLNNDTVVKPNFLTVLVNKAEKDAKIGLLSPKILYYKSNKIWSMGGTVSYPTGISIMIGKGKDSNRYQKIIEPDFLTGCAMLIKKEVVNKIGLLDPTYFAYYEDTDYSYRTRSAGYKVQTIPQSVIWHKKSASAGIKGSNKMTPFQAYFIGRNAVIFAKKNLSFPLKQIYLASLMSLKIVLFANRFAGMNSLKSYVKGMIDATQHV